MILFTKKIASLVRSHTQPFSSDLSRISPCLLVEMPPCLYSLLASPALALSNSMLVISFVKKSAGFLVPAILRILICFLSLICWTQVALMSMCFIFEVPPLFLANPIAAAASTYTGSVGSRCSASSSAKYCVCSPLWIEVDSALDSASAEDVAIQSCLVEHQSTGMPL